MSNKIMKFWGAFFGCGAWLFYGIEFCFVDTLKSVSIGDLEEDKVAKDGCIFSREKAYKLQGKLDQILDL